ncbi:cation:proton antiporter [Sodalinema gerasimenkoae]|uniref:cation:proton antiporter domain-containing protein n=1 Tax=Sodalinema gerasimenkoae TaxID=2862348 RepID=UPI00135783FA|nr:cation:proton antiporter [Sodalinema gerasimenkoae]
MDSLFNLSLPAEDPVLIFSICMAVILIAPLLFERINLPGVTGPIVAGVVLGPSVLNVLEQGQALTLLGNVGLLYIMFLAGLEIDMTQFLRHRDRSLVFGLITFTIPQTLGTIIFRLMGFDWLASILIASMFASHTLVAYPIISRLGIIKNNAVTTTVGGTILTDTVALLLLVVVARSSQGDLDAQFWITLGLALILYVTAILYLLPPLARWFFRNIGSNNKPAFVFVITTLFVFSYLADAIGIEKILGAFLVGLTLNRLIPERSRLMSRIQFFGDGFIIPFFLIFIGLLVDVSVLASGMTAWIVMGAMLATNVGTKWIASMVTRKIYNYSHAEGMVMFGLSTCEAAATLAATLVGYELGIIGDDVLNGVVMMIFATCILGPSIVEYYGRQVAQQDHSDNFQPRNTPQRILVPLANPATSDALIEVAALLRDHKSNEAIVPLTVVTTQPDDDRENAESNVAKAERLLAHAVVHAAEMDLTVNPVTRIAANPAVGMVEAALERRTSDIVIGWNGKQSPEQRIFGGVIDQMLEQTSQQVWVCKLDSPLNTYGRITVILPPLIDYMPGFYEAARSLKHFATQLGVTLNVVTSEESQRQIRQCLETIPLKIETTFTPAATWRDSLKDTDLVVLVSARLGTIAHTGQLEQLPRELAASRASFLVLYPSQREAVVYDVHPPQSPLALFDPQRVQLGLTTSSYEKTVEALLSTAIAKDNPKHWSVLKALVYDDVGYASEILPGMIISHARVPKLDRTLMFMATHPTGVHHEQSAQSIHVVVLLLSPSRVSSQDHLAQLAEIARYLSHVTNLDQVIASQQPEQLKSLFQARRTTAI